MRDLAIQDNVRADGRQCDEVRPIACRAGLLPCTHGSALFTRGETQTITVATLGMPSARFFLCGPGPLDACTPPGDSGSWSINLHLGESESLEDCSVCSLCITAADIGRS